MRVAIVGGGITGLALTHALARAGVDSVLFEESDRAGGIISSARFDGHVFEQGPQRTRLVPSVKRLIDELGLSDRVVIARPDARLFVWSRGRLRVVKARPAALVSSDLLTPAGRLRLAVEPLTDGLRAHESVAGFFRRKVGDEAYGTLFGPLVSATFAADPERMPARHSLPMILGPLGVRRSLLAAARRWRPTGSPACTFRSGMEELPAALHARHRERIRLGSRVTGVAASRNGVSVRLASGDTEDFDRVVLTTPAGVASEILEAGPPVPGLEALSRLRYNEVAIVSLSGNVGRSGFGFQTAFDSPWRTRGVTWAGSLFDRPGVSTAYLGGGLDPEIADWSDADVADCAAREFRDIHGRSAEPLAVARASLPAYDDSWDALGDLVLPDGVTIAANYRGRLGIAARIAQAEALADGFASDVATG